MMMKTIHLLIICGTVIIVAWLAFLPFRYHVQWRQYEGTTVLDCYYLDCWTGACGHQEAR